MAKFKNKAQLSKAPKEEVVDFFKHTVFEGVFSSELKSKRQDRYRGHVHSIKINGVPTSILGTFINVPTNMNRVQEGACTFMCTPSYGEDNMLYINLVKIQNEVISIAPRSSEYTKSTQSRVRQDTSEDRDLKKYLKLPNHNFIGLFTQNKDGSFTIRDIRRTDFSKLILQNGKEQGSFVYHPKFQKPKSGKYYEFTWILNGADYDTFTYNFKVDDHVQLKEVNARDIVGRLHDGIMNYSADAGQKIVNMLDTLKNQLTASGKEIFIYELLQNANDYPVEINGEKQKVDVEFRITLQSLIFMHSGAYFNARNIAAICSINDKEKTDNKDTIGYKGIGFKTVFLDNNYVYLQTGDFSFRFDEEYSRKIVDTPWQILPVWTDYKLLTSAERAIFTNADNKFRVKFSLRPKNQNVLMGIGHNYKEMFKDVFSNERVILFIPNISSVKVYLDGTDVPNIVCKSDPEKWVVSDFVEPVDSEITETINDDINKQEETGSLKIPTKYYDFKKTKVSFACELDGAKLKPVSDANLYCYLPTKASWGFKFLMNTDMIPTGPRDDIEVEFDNQININAEISKIAGNKFVKWIKYLCEEKSYVLTSIFALIPDFDKIKDGGYKKYIDLITRFEEGFESKLRELEIIPISNSQYALLEDTIYDTTGLMESGIMSDDDFYKITGYTAKLPVNLLRSSDCFCDFQEKYLKQFDCEDQIWTKEDFINICDDSDFQEWVGKQDNNNKLLNFLLERGWLDDFADKEIFLDQDGDLHKASDIFYEIDDYKEDISAFADLFSYLSPNTRSYFADNTKWEEGAVSLFASFDADNFVDDLLLSDDNIVDTKERLKTKDTSIHFYKFLAENVSFSQDYLGLPFFDDDDNVIDDFYDKFIFCSSKKGATIFDSSWLDNVEVAFLAKDYFKVTLDYFKANETFGVSDYSDEFVVEDIILSDDYHDIINEAQQKDYDTSKSFVDFCYKNKEYINEGVLSNYALGTYDKEGEYDYVLSEDNIYFPSALYDDLSSKEWLSNGWMYCLDENYFKGDDEEKKFIKDAFGVANLTDKRFYREVVRPNLDDIIENTSGSNDGDGEKNIDFVAYLDKNYTLIFEEEKDKDKFNKLVLLGHKDDGGVYDISANASYVYLYDDELLDIIQQEWFPDNLVDICTEKYGESKAVKTIGVKKYEFKTFFDDVITEEVSIINDAITSLEHSVAFHQLVINNKSELTPTQLEVMQKAKVYLYNNDAEDSSAGHKILSEAANELAGLNLVDFSDLDIIDPAYPIKGNTDYWKDRLGNTSFSVNDFAAWIEENEDAFAETIGDAELNIAFWRWAKENLSKQTEKLVNLPILLSDDSSAKIDDVIYLSNDYIVEGGIESIVKKYDNDANFVSNSYIDDEDDIESWKSFWVSVGLHSEIMDILTNTIIPKLDEIEDETLPATLAKHLSKLEEEYGEEILNTLGHLRVKGQDGTFYALSDSIYIDCEDTEPFKFIHLPNQIVFSPSSLVTERRLVKDLVNNEEGIIIEGVKAWIVEKINHYLDIQDSDDEDLLRSVHFDFINELSAMYKEDDTSLTNYADSLKEVMILDENEEFASGAELTMSSVYNPFCDFQSYLPDSYTYTSDSYDTECEYYVGKLLRKYMDVHSDFKKSDIENLSDRLFSVYFWSKYLPLKKEKSNILGIKELIKDGLFNEIKCIPTKDFMSKPSSLYSTKISNYVKKTEDWENKLPIESIPNIEYANGETLFDLMPFKTSLSFGDCLYAIFSYNGVETRSTLVNWMLEQYDNSCNDKVLEYRADEDALWTNVKNDKVHISKLYALDEGKDSTLLNEYFGSSEMIINRNYFPSTDFIEACEMLQIDIITKDDLEVVPKNAVVKGDEAKHKLYVFALIIAGIESSDDWQNKYAYFKEKIDEICLCKCDAISIEYVNNRSLNVSLKKFHPDYEKKIFYYVGKLDSPLVFKDFVLAFINHLNIELSADYISNMMYEGEAYAIDLIKERNELMLDDSFKTQLDELIPGIKKELVGTESYDIDEEEQDKRHTYTNAGQDSEEGGEETTDEEETTDITDIQMVESNEEENHPTNIDSRSSHSPSNNQTGARSLSYNPGRRINTSSQVKVQDGHRRYTDNRGWEDYSRTYKSQAPKPFSPDDVNNFGSKGVTRHLEVLEPSTAELADINRILGGDLSAEQVADQNYLAQLRLYRNLQKKGWTPKQSEEDFVRSTGMTNEHELTGGKYIHKCSAAGGIMYLSPSIWNKIADDNCIVCVYLGAKANEFMYFNSIDEILDWINEDDIVIKLTGEERAKVVQELYSGVLNGVKGTAYTMIRLSSDEKYNSLFAQLPGDPNNDDVENEEDY